MPKWGLTADQRITRPWGLDAKWLKPSKTITEPVHQDVYLTEIERSFVDSRPVQRLRRVRQLGTTALVYPGATHTRFAHSIGTLRSAQDLLDAVLDQRNGPRPKLDLFGEWWSEDAVDTRRREFNKWIAEATVLARLGGLLHDLCHVPFGHSIEDDLAILTPHDANEARLEELWSQLPVELRDAISPELRDALGVLIVSKRTNEAGEIVSKEAGELGRYAFVFDIVGNTICADLLDYLSRDHLYTGLPARFGHRFIDGFYVVPTSARYNGGRVAIKIKKGATIRADVVTELFKFLRYRYELSERALAQHAKVAADAMIGKALEIWYDALRAERLTAQHPEIRQSGDIDDDVRPLGPAERLALENGARRTIESQMITRSDDGILEYLRDEAVRLSGNPRMDAVGDLVGRVLDRDLYEKLVRSADEFRPMAGEVFRKFGSAADRRRLERDCARYVELDPRWYVLLWIPAPKMRMKAAEVLVDDDERILPLDTTSYRDRGLDIYEAHRALWAVTVYVHRSVSDDQREVIQAWLSRELGIGWSEVSVESSGSRLSQIALRVVARDLDLSAEAIAKLSDRDIAASAGTETFAELVTATRIAAREFIEDAPPTGRRRKPKTDVRQPELPLEQ
jgi:HD superfamily phosphohydrolase